MPQAARVDVAEALAQSLADVVAEARDRHAADLATYREAVCRMAESDGTLPPEESRQLLDAAARLGIQPDRLSADATVMLRHGRLEAHIAAAMQQEAKQAQVVADLKAKVDAESAIFVRVRAESMAKMQAAEATLNEAQRLYREADAVRPERVDEQQEGMARLRDEAPWLFRHVDAEDLRRMLS